MAARAVSWVVVIAFPHDPVTTCSHDILFLSDAWIYHPRYDSPLFVQKKVIDHPDDEEGTLVKLMKGTGVVEGWNGDVLYSVEMDLKRKRCIR